MNRQLSAAIIATFRSMSAAEHRSRLRAFPAVSWERNLSWLDASGLALYFLKQLRLLGIEDSVPPSIRSQLEQRHADNQRRTACLLEEFARINNALSARDIHYANLKGFTLVPDYCPDLSLRCQMDCDFLIDPDEAAQSCNILSSLGYSVVAANRHVIELKTTGGNTPRITDLYKANRERVVELHLCDDARPDRHPSLLERVRLLTIHGGRYPALSADDMFLSQASHLFRHLRSEWTRVSWLLELKQCVAAHSGDAGFWQAVRTRADHDQQSTMAISASLLMARKAFGNCVGGELAGWSPERLPASTALWIERYGNEVLLAGFPGSKLYLILEQELSAGEQTKFMVRRRLFPRRAPGRFAVNPSSGLVQRARAARASCSYFLFRMRFHIAAGSQYLVESWRWNRLRKRRLVKDAYPAANCAVNAAD